MKRQQIWLIVIISTLCFAATSIVHAAQKYEVVDLGERLYPSCFNENGQVVLVNGAGYGETRNIYLWDNGVTNQIYTTNDWLGRTSINDSGTIAVYLINHNDPHVPEYSLLINGNQMQTIPSCLWDINNAGQLVQLSPDVTSVESVRTYLRDTDGSLVDCENSADMFTHGTSINDLGQITGAVGIDYYLDHGFVWDSVSGKRYLPPLDGDISAVGYDINNHGQVVGYSATSMDPHWMDQWDLNLVLWDADGTIHDLGCKLFQFNRPVVFNDFGQIVADVKLPGDSDFALYYWEEDLGFIEAQDLLDENSPWTITALEDINNQGQIIGVASGHAVLLNPVPEPTTISLMLLGLIWIKTINLAISLH